MIGFVVGKMELEQMEPLVDGLDESAASGQEVDGPDAAMGDAAIAEGELVVDVGGGEAGPIVQIDLQTLNGLGSILVEATLETVLAARPLISYPAVHSKLPFRTSDVVWLLHQTSRKSLEFRVFSILRPAERWRRRLFKD